MALCSVDTSSVFSFKEMKSSDPITTEKDGLESIDVDYITVINYKTSYQIPEKYIKISGYMCRHFNLATQDDPTNIKKETDEPPLSSDISTITLDGLNITQPTWECILTYLNHHKGEFINRMPSPLPDDTQLTDIVNDIWDVNYIEKVEIKDMLILISAAELLDIRSLVNLIVVKLSIMLKNDPTSDIKNMLMNI